MERSTTVVFLVATQGRTVAEQVLCHESLGGVLLFLLITFQSLPPHSRV
jgi:hypothetical protein